jgi:hypothetical protein
LKNSTNKRAGRPAGSRRPKPATVGRNHPDVAWLRKNLRVLLPTAEGRRRVCEKIFSLPGFQERFEAARARDAVVVVWANADQLIGGVHTRDDFTRFLDPQGTDDELVKDLAAAWQPGTVLFVAIVRGHCNLTPLAGAEWPQTVKR